MSFVNAGYSLEISYSLTAKNTNALFLEKEFFEIIKNVVSDKLGMFS